MRARWPRTAWVVVLLGLGHLLGLGLAAPAAAISRQAATRVAVRALGVRHSSSPAIVFALRRPLGARTTLNQDGPGPGERVTVRRNQFGATLTIHLSRRRIGRSAWLFWEDLQPYAEFAHPSLLILIDARTGRVLGAHGLAWEPLVDGRVPAFLSSERGYVSRRYRVFTRLRRARAIDTAPDAAPRPSGDTGGGQLGFGLQSAFNSSEHDDFFDFNSGSQPQSSLPQSRTESDHCGLEVTLYGERPVARLSSAGPRGSSRRPRATATARTAAVSATTTPPGRTSARAVRGGARQPEQRLHGHRHAAPTTGASARTSAPSSGRARPGGQGLPDDERAGARPRSRRALGALPDLPAGDHRAARPRGQ